MAAKISADDTLVLMAIKFVQPGLLGDVVEGVRRLMPASLEYHVDKERVRLRLERLRRIQTVGMYEGRRYVLTPLGEQQVKMTGLVPQLDARRIFLLKETRRARN